MDKLAFLYIFLLIETTIVNLAIVIYTLFVRNQRFVAITRLAFSMPLLWALTNLLGAISPDIGVAAFWLQEAHYAVVFLTPPVLMMFALVFSGRVDRVPFWIMVAINTLPVASIMVLFSPWQELIVAAPQLEQFGGYYFLVGEVRNLGFWVNGLWGLAVFLLGLYFLLSKVFSSLRYYRLIRILLLVGSLLPAVGLVINWFWWGELPLPDLGAMAFGLFTPVWAWAVFRNEVLNVAPIAREAVMENMEDGVFVLDHQDHLVDVNPSGAAILGAQRELILNEPVSQVFAGQTSVLAGIDREMDVQTEIKVDRAGADYFYDLKISILRNPMGDRAGRLIVLRDITGRKKDEQLLARLVGESQQREQESETLREASAVVVSSLDMQTAIELVLEQLEKVIPYTSASVQLLRDGYLEIVGGRGFADPSQIVGLRFPTVEGRRSGPELKVFQSHEPQIYEDAQLHFPEFREPPHNHIHGWMGVPLLWRGELIGVVTIDSDQIGAYDERSAEMALAFADQIAMALSNAQLFEQVRLQAERDPLTGLFNRRHFFHLFGGVYRAQRELDGCLTVLMVDVDLFKSINDRHGHTIGDQVLVGLAEYIQSLLREEDILARFGGEEFILLLPGADAGQAEQIADRLRSQIEATPLASERGPISITVSIGTCTHDFARDPFLSMDEIVDRADLALLAAKQNGRNQVREYAN